MNVDKLIQHYFSNDGQPPIIEVFDDDNISKVCHSIIDTLKNAPEIEICVLEAFNYCFYEILDNVLVHSEKAFGTAITRYIPQKSLIQVLVADDGIGVHKSLTNNSLYKDIDEEAALLKCIEDKVTDGKGMGFGLYSTMRLVQTAGHCLKIHSGSHILTADGSKSVVAPCNYWQGTVIYLELKSDTEYDSDKVVGADCQSEFEDYFLDENLENLW